MEVFVFLFMVFLAIVLIGVPCYAIFYVLTQGGSAEKYAEYAKHLARLKREAFAKHFQLTDRVSIDQVPHFLIKGFWTYYCIVRTCPHKFWHCITLANDSAIADPNG